MTYSLHKNTETIIENGSRSRLGHKAADSMSSVLATFNWYPISCTKSPDSNMVDFKSSRIGITKNDVGLLRLFTL